MVYLNARASSARPMPPAGTSCAPVPGGRRYHQVRPAADRSQSDVLLTPVRLRLRTAQPGLTADRLLERVDQACRRPRGVGGLACRRRLEPRRAHVALVAHARSVGRGAKRIQGA
eukprot:2737699-Pleurochrysis_carterae.AAC.2